MQIIDVCPDDLDEVLRLNDDSVPHVSRIDSTQMEWFANNAQYFRVARVARRARWLSDWLAARITLCEP